MNLVDELKAALPGWTVTPDDGLIDADKGDVNIQVHTVGSSVVACMFVGIHLAGDGVGKDGQSVVDSLRGDLATTAKRCAAALDALGGVK